MVEFKNVSKTFADTGEVVFRDLNFLVRDGEFVLLTGESGVGKTTVLRLLLKELEPDAGKVWDGERDISTIPYAEVPYYRRNFGVMFQDHRLLPNENCYQNIELARIVTGGNTKDSPRKIGSLMKLLGIENYYKRLPGELSGGEQAKVCLARALVNNPQVLIADEPTANLDPHSSEEFLKLLLLIHSGVHIKTTIIVATHDAILKECDKAREIPLEEGI